MKNKNNTLLVTTSLGLFIGAIINLIQQYFETKERQEDFGWDKIDWKRTGKSALIGGAVGLAAGAVIKLVGEEEEEFYPSHHLNKVLRQHSLAQNPQVLEQAIEKRNEIKEFLIEYFANDLVGNPLNWGSYSHGTANSSNFDLDIIVPFSRNIGSLKAMHQKVYKAIDKHFDDSEVELVRLQGKSIGVKYNINGEEMFIDIVPGREINNYKRDNELKLYVSPGKYGGKSSSIKTNTKVHKAEITGLTDERKLTRLTKIWRDRHGLNFKSIAIRNMVINAFDCNSSNIPYDIFGKLEMVLKYIQENVKVLRIVDSANSNNIISDSMTIQEKSRIADQAAYDLARLAKDPNYLENLFKL